jgi:hypothetical protein
MNVCAVILEIAGTWVIVSVIRMGIADIRKSLAAKRKR